MMTAKQLVDKAIDIAKNYKTLYVMGCFGAPMTAANKTRLINHHEYNRRSAPKAAIQAATADTFGFDCVCLIKAILWGWNGNKSATNGGSKYVSSGVPDINADSMIKRCTGVTTNFSKIEVGEALWCSGHIGVYIGDGLAVECTPAWKNCVQITAVGNIGTKAGYNTRKWTKHGKLPYVTYTGSVESGQQTTPPAAQKPTAGVSAQKKTAEPAKSFSRSHAKTYTVNASALNMRTGAGTNKTTIKALKRGDKVTCYGYYTMNGSTTWLYVKDQSGTVGYCSKKYLI